ncbi:hypothetical protein GJ496_003622 [Pomphorhynchus laevis]|nr:hypothetical protein GJ496_003622 [Pomphorhynchus laevis]
MKTSDMFKEIVDRLKDDDQVRGAWEVNNITKQGTIWCDASSLAIVVCLEIALSFALDWNLRGVSIMTNSKCVYGWVKSAIEQLKPIHIKGNSPALLKRRLVIIRYLQECKLRLNIDLVTSLTNKAVTLTRVPADWFKIITNSIPRVFSAHLAIGGIRREHERHHLCVDRSLYLAISLGANVCREDVDNVVQNCIKCQSIDPAPLHWSEGELGVEVNNWKILAIDVTHYKGQDYLSIIAAGPSRFTTWKEFKQFANQNGIEVIYRFAYEPNTNGIIERCHRTIKRICARTSGYVQEMIFWYNASPKNGTNQATALTNEVYKYDYGFLTSNRGISIIRTHWNSKLRHRQQVFVKPKDTRCTTIMNTGIITDIQRENVIEVAGIPCPIADIHAISMLDSEDDQSSQTNTSKYNIANISHENQMDIDGITEGINNSEPPEIRYQTR